MFGQNKPGLFGSPQPTAPAFGASNTTFGAGTTTTPFGVQQQPTTSLFGASTGSTFGGMGTPAAGTSSLFSNNQQTSIFGNTSTAQTPFGQTNTANTFGRPAGGIFGATTPANTGLGQTVGGFGMGFGSQSAFGATAGQAVTGTTVKFNPTPGSDTMLKNGATQSISTRHQCITVMKEYEGKSLEELRMEDYAAGRKGPAAGTTVGAFGTTPTATGLFGANTTTPAVSGFGTGSSIFGNSAQKTTFGTSSLTPATQSTTSLFGNTSFSKPTGFGTTPTFGAAVQPQQQVQPQPQTSLFGATTTSQPFGQNFFNNQAQNTAQKSFFGQAVAQPQQQQQTTSLFGANTGLNTGINTSVAKPLFGATTPAFSGGLGTSSAFGGFGTTATATTTSSLFSTNQSLFGNNAPKPTTSFSFSTPGQTSFPSLGQTAPSLNTGSSLFGTNSAFGTNTGTGLFQSSLGTQSSLFPSMQQNQMSLTGFQGMQNNSLTAGQGPLTNPSNEMILTRLRTLPYGVSPLFQNDLTMSSSGTSSQFTTDAKTLNQYKLSSAEPVVKRMPASSKPVLLFDDVEDDDESTRVTAADIFQPKKSIKKLVFAPKPTAQIEPVRSPLFASGSPDKTPSHTEIKKVSVSPADNTICEFIKNRENGDRSRRGLNFSIDTLPDDEETSASIHNESSVPVLRCGLVQTRQDYYTIPKLEDMDNFYDEEKDTCIVDTFTIGRKGYGSIFWNCSVDLKGLNLDEIVHIRRKEVIVYPDDDDKPPVGEGLNKPAQITLDQVWPIDKNSHEIIKDVKRLDELNYASKLEATTVRLNAVFKDYRPETGSWVFNVKHFSKYGLFDDEDDDVEMVDTSSKVLKARPSLPPAPTPRLSLEQIHNKKDSDVPDKSQVIRQISSFPSSITTSFEQIFMDFPKPEDYVYKGPMRPSSEEKSLKPSYPMFEYYEGIRSVLFDDDVIQESERKPSKRSKVRSPSESLLISPSSVAQVKQRPSVKIPQVQVTKRQLKFLHNPFPSRNKVILDISSIKCPSAPVVRFYNGSRNLMSVQGKTITLSTTVSFPDLNEEPALVERFIEQLKTQTLIQSHEHYVPFADVRRNSINPLYSPELNGLVVALYGELKSKNEYEAEEERRNAVIDWLTERNKGYGVPADPYARIFYFLSINDVKSAVDEAIRSNQPRLALILSCGTCSLSKDEILSQLDSWKVSGADRFIDASILKLYILLSGQTDWTLSTDETVASIADLHWSQQLALTLVYCPDVPMSELIDNLPADSADVEYHLLAQHQKNKWLVFDYCDDELDSWFLHQSLVSFNAIPRDPKSDSLHATVASQLMSQSVVWSVFVAMHVADHMLRQRILSDVLMHNGSSISPEDESFLQQSLLVSGSDIASAKAVFSMSSFDDIGHCMSLLDCGKWSLAHDLLVDRIFPHLVINEETDLLADLIDRMRPHRASISNWYTSGAHMFDVYRQVVAGDESVVSLLAKDPVSMHLMKCPTPKHRLAQSEMVHKIGLFCTTHGTSADLMTGAPLPDDYVLIHSKKSAYELINKLLL